MKFDRQSMHKHVYTFVDVLDIIISHQMYNIYYLNKHAQLCILHLHAIPDTCSIYIL